MSISHFFLDGIFVADSRRVCFFLSTTLSLIILNFYSSASCASIGLLHWAI